MALPGAVQGMHEVKLRGYSGGRGGNMLFFLLAVPDAALSGMGFSGWTVPLATELEAYLCHMQSVRSHRAAAPGSAHDRTQKHGSSRGPAHRRPELTVIAQEAVAKVVLREAQSSQPDALTSPVLLFRVTDASFVLASEQPCSLCHLQVLQEPREPSTTHLPNWEAASRRWQRSW